MKHIIIVGGSKGIGFSIIKQLEQQEHNIVNLSRTKPSLSSNNINHFSFDILSENSFPIIEQVDTLIYCPGSINLKPFSRLSIDDFNQDFNINVLGAVKFIQNFLPQLKKATNPSILLFSSVATKLGMPFHSSIATSKSALEGLVKSLAAEFAPTIRVNAIAPTVTNTQLASKLLRNDKTIANIKERHPLKEFLDPDDVANMATYLISDKAKSISGQIFELDYGIVNLKL